MAVLDREANQSSTSKIGFESPEQKGVGLSSILLLQNKEPVKGKVAPADPLEFQLDPTVGERLVPELGTNLTPQPLPPCSSWFIRIKRIADKPKIQAGVFARRKVLGKQMADLPAPDATGADPDADQCSRKAGRLRAPDHRTARQFIHDSKSKIHGRGEIAYGWIKLRSHARPTSSAVPADRDAGSHCADCAYHV